MISINITKLLIARRLCRVGVLKIAKTVWRYRKPPYLTLRQFNNYTVQDIVARLNHIDRIAFDSTRASHLAKKFLRLEGEQLEMARYGLERYFYYCGLCGTSIDRYALTEIIDDAYHDISWAIENEIDIANAKEYYRNNPLSVEAFEHSLKPFGAVSRKQTA